MADIRPKSEPVKFFFTMNMQSRSGNPTHQVVGSARHVNSLGDLVELMQHRDFIIVEEFYKNPDGSYYSRGDTILNTAHIGKVKVNAP
jgi:hypothetical protein